ncbi:MAG: MFS transporter, partial [Candidatus Brocadiia bacterium]|nr:MFS transporter [Candidatus Brocadiia bacterium]
RNVFWMLIGRLLTSSGAVFIAAPVFQAYLVSAGLDTGQIGTIGSVGSVAAGVGMFALMGVADRIQNRIRTVVLCLLALTITPIVLAVLSQLGPEIQTAGTVLIVVMVLRIVEQFADSFRSMVRSSMMVRTFQVNIRGRLTGIAGLISGLATLGLGLVTMKVLRELGAPLGFTACFALAPVLYLAGALVRLNLRELPELKRPGRSGSAFPWAAIWDVLRLREFRVLVAPNLLRGAVAGVAYFAWVVGIQRLELPPAYAGLGAAVNAVAGTLLGSVAIGLFLDRRGPGPVLFAGGVLGAIAMVAMVLAPSPPVFLGFYGLFVFGMTLTGGGVPLGVFETAPPEMMGAFNGARLMLTIAATAVSMSAAGQLVKALGPFPVFVAGAALSVVTGIWYWHAFRRTK